jgi:hypothetical protein
MKILFLNPHIDAEHHIVRVLQEKGYAVLVSGYPEEAWHLLQIHGTTVDIAVVHIEGRTPEEGSQGFSFITRFKGDLNHSDLPFVITSEVWGDQEFARHQQTSMGANGYLRWPATADGIFKIVREILGAENTLTTPPALPKVDGGVHLEDSRLIFAGIKDGNPAGGDQAIVLEAPPEDVTRVPEKSKTIPTAMFVNNLPELLPLASIPSPDEPDAEFGGKDSAQQPSDIQTLNLNTVQMSPAETAPMEISPAAENPFVSPTESPVAIEFGSVTDKTMPIRQSEVKLDSPDIQFNPAAELKDPEKKTQSILQSPVADDESAREAMPYLFNKSDKKDEKNTSTREAAGLAFALAQAVGDAVVPGGAVQSPDVETLKKYLTLREQDVAVLSTQLKTVKEQVLSMERILQEERAKNADLSHQNDVQRKKLEDFDREKMNYAEGIKAELDELRYQMKAKNEKARVLENQVRDAADETEKLKDRVKADIRKIRVREKELENKLEILKKDSEALVSSRENKIIELKRKIDLLEFNMDLLQDQYTREKEKTNKLKDRISRAAQVVRVAGGLLDAAANSPEMGSHGLGDKQHKEAS